MDNKIKKDIETLRKNAEVVYVASVNEEGFPQIKAMFTAEHDKLGTQLFSTNTSSKRADQFMKNPKAGVYYCDEENFIGVLFTGTIEVCNDHDTKASIWREGDEMYYPKGVDDEDYCVFRFTAETVNYYHGLSNATFSIDELE